MAQEMLPRSQGMAGGLVLGFANGIGGLLVFVTGVIIRPLRALRRDTLADGHYRGRRAARDAAAR